MNQIDTLGCAVPIVDAIVTQAINRGASDIHFEPESNHLRIRLRIDGVLADQAIVATLQKNSYSSK
jgi:type II secretory ATPase GspE/PulE/Tfp pilus assembly ATPase PilB-like protein